MPSARFQSWLEIPLTISCLHVLWVSWVGVLSKAAKVLDKELGKWAQ